MAGTGVSGAADSERLLMATSLREGEERRLVALEIDRRDALHARARESVAGERLTGSE